MEAQSHAAPLLAQSIDGRGLAQEALARLVSTGRAGALALAVAGGATGGGVLGVACFTSSSELGT